MTIFETLSTLYIAFVTSFQNKTTEKIKVNNHETLRGLSTTSGSIPVHFMQISFICFDFRCATTSSDSSTGSKDDHSPPSMREDCQIDEKEASSTSFLNGCHVTKDNDTTCSGNVISINQQSQLGLVQGIY